MNASNTFFFFLQFTVTVIFKNKCTSEEKKKGGDMPRI